MPLADGATFAGYTIIRLLGAGGMGEVYLAQHPRLPRQDALKVLTASVTDDSEYRERFEREADMVAALWHPHIVGVHDRGDCDGQLWISMDYVDGTDAGALIKEQGNGLPPAEVVKIVTAVAEALDYAHARHLLHRDVKPANILIAHPGASDQRILLGDFGIARREDDTDGLTATNMTVGTVSYAAPEQLMGDDLDGRADQYALAATAFHLLTGNPPFQHSNPAVVISQHLTAAPPKLAVVRPELAHLDPALTKALSKEPSKRFARCVDFARALGHQLGAAEVADPLAPGDVTRQALPRTGGRHARRTTPPKRPWLRPALLIPAILGVLLVAAVAFAVGEFTGDREAGEAAATTRVTTTTSVPRAVSVNPVAPTTAATAAPSDIPDIPPYVPGMAAVGARCAEPGATGSTPDGATTYCANLQYTDRYLWSLNPGEIPNPVLTTSPEVPPPYEDESPVRICVEQTGRSRLRCAEEIFRGNQP